MKLAADRIIIAPGDAHLTIEPDGRSHAVRLVRERSPSGCLPSVDPMFASAGAMAFAAGFMIVADREQTRVFTL